MADADLRGLERLAQEDPVARRRLLVEQARRALGGGDDGMAPAGFRDRAWVLGTCVVIALEDCCGGIMIRQFLVQ